MSKSQETWNKKEREKQKQKARQEKEERKKERKERGKAGIDNMMAYVDENGNLSDSPPDPRKKIVVNAADIEIGVTYERVVDPKDLVRTGTVSFFNEEKGYGIIREEQSGQSIFVHINNCQGPIQQNSKVNFEIEKGPKGSSAINVKHA